MRGGGTFADENWYRAAPVARVFAALDGEQDQTRIVGGAVRNALLGAPPGDIDFATELLPETVVEKAKSAGLKTVPTGLAHGTVTIIADGHPFEVTTLRVDVETHGRHATVAFSEDWAEDAARRDFTMNALYLSADGTLHDPLGTGIADTKARRVRFIGDPHDRIREDFLRVLRFFRFEAWYGHDTPDAAAMAACAAEKKGLIGLSAERIHGEMAKLLAATDPSAALAAMVETGVAEIVFQRPIDREAVGHLVAIEAENGIAPEPVMRLAALLRLKRADVPEIRDRYRLSNRETTRLQATAIDAPAPNPGDVAGARVFLFEHGVQAFRDAALIAWARSGRAPDDAACRALLRLPETWRPPAFPLTGEDVLQKGVQPGPAVGEALDAARAAWIASGFTADREALLALVPAAKGS